MAVHEHTYVFVIGTFFAMLDAYNNGANDVANAWATSVSSRSISYRQAMIFGTVFELLGAITVGARTADTIKNGIIPNSAFQNNAGVQMLAFTCALAAASSWVMWCTRHSAHVSSTYSLVSAVAGVGVATVGAPKVQWGWNKGKGLGAIFAGLAMAPAISGGFGATIFMLIKLVVHIRKNPVPWAIYSSPAFFLIAGTICTLSIVYKGSPKLGLNKKPAWYIVAVSLGTGGGLCILAAIFFVPFVHAKVVKRDHTIKWWMFVLGPALYNRPAPVDATKANVPNYAVVQNDEGEESSNDSIQSANGSHEAIKTETGTAPSTTIVSSGQHEKSLAAVEANQLSHKELLIQGREKLHAKLRKKRSPIGWAMRHLHANPMGVGPDIRYGSPPWSLWERYMVFTTTSTPHKQVSWVPLTANILTACTASFAHGANDIGNSVGPWAVIYGAWKTGNAAASKAPVDVWQLAVLSLTISLGLLTYGYNIMKVMGNKITYHSPSRGCSMEMGAAITVLVFSQYSLPVSTSMCITGATVGVGLCNGTLKAVNWHRVGLLMLSWIATIPIAGTLGGVLMGLFLNAPHFR
ncbi:hypothetical protein PABG_03676 [Paracoccidioides brasiliensis Pb03]|nr:hypothetical protein PABG_03676 [Paracoccidioides brasiliensis Pb03]